ncbi:MAG TPA: cyclopropane-fatty-acyl-phospholipid synthase family protein [Bacteroidia bacterium]|nr:cyclopropane-fatty-acyl-phospholipid synthase family protein [Bacteroidia bacterium]
MNIDSLLEKNLLPDSVIRPGIRRLLKERLRDEKKSSPGEQQEHFNSLLEVCRNSPLAIETQAANEQHYEVPTEFYLHCLGPNLKYSSAFYRPGVTSLEQAEKDMLALTCQRAELENGMEILELGCGWGSLTLWMGKHFPGAKITAVSNSRTQKEFIDGEAKKRGISNITIITADMNVFSTEKKFDRVVSVEMFEHMRNHGLLLKRISGWMKDDAKLFVHIFVHRDYLYFFEVKNERDWMSKYFFTGGMMPSDHYLYYWNDDLRVKKHWRVSGIHYSKTSEAWLANMDAEKKKIIPLFEKTYGKKEARKWWVYWRVFFMACAELWGYADGGEWFVGHYLLEK